MASSTPFNATNVGIYVSGDLVAYARSGSFSVNIAEIDTTSKDNSGWQNNILGMRDWTMEVEAIMTLDASSSLDAVFDLATGRTSCNIKFSSETSSDNYYHGTAYVTSLTANAPMEDVGTWSATFKGSGALTQTNKT